jgi:hypothetical protein
MSIYDRALLPQRYMWQQATGMLGLASQPPGAERGAAMRQVMTKLRAIARARTALNPEERKWMSVRRLPALP